MLAEAPPGRGEKPRGTSGVKKEAEGNERMWGEGHTGVGVCPRHTGRPQTATRFSACRCHAGVKHPASAHPPLFRGLQNPVGPAGTRGQRRSRAVNPSQEAAPRCADLT